MGPSIWQLLIIVLIVVLLFGTKRLSSLGSDLGNAIKGFKKSVSNDEADKGALPPAADSSDKSDSHNDQQPPRA